MPLCAVAYVSDVAGPLSAEQLDALVDDAVRFNSLAGVTGVLLFDGGRFLQYFEGPDDGVSAVHERVLQARSHRAIVALGHARVPKRYFPYWSMRWLGVEPAMIEQLASGDWQAFADPVQGGPPPHGGMERLLRFVAPHQPSISAGDAAERLT
ncbi:BLUF domain-containing protein [Stenotrophomonas sp. TWI819]|uniref:BLUF domain-containing protein n=1 Tax=Stenotrophomonas sp. TWI819 TaxID=3136800 RepID=UPI00320A1747